MGLTVNEQYYESTGRLTTRAGVSPLIYRINLILIHKVHIVSHQI